MIPLYKYFNFAVMLGFTGIFIGSMIRGIFDKIYIWMIEGVSTVILFSFWAINGRIISHIFLL